MDMMPCTVCLSFLKMNGEHSSNSRSFVSLSMPRLVPLMSCFLKWPSRYQVPDLKNQPSLSLIIIIKHLP